MKKVETFTNVVRWGMNLWIVLCMSSAFQSCNMMRKTLMHADMRTDTTLLGLFYGMEEDGDAICPLDTLPGILKLECKASWKTGEYMEDVTDAFKYDVLLRVYVDSIYPTEQVMRTVAVKMDRMFQRDFVNYIRNSEYASCGDYMDNLLNFGDIKSGVELRDYFERWVDEFDKIKNAEQDKNSLEDICPLRYSLVACRLFENEKVATYLFESSVDYHGSSGCPSSADYLTIDKKTGKVLGYNDMFCPEVEADVDALLRQAYIDEQNRRGENFYGAVDGLMNSKFRNNCALVKEGVLFFYHPYDIGCGADGQYNLIIDKEVVAIHLKQ